MLSDGKTNGGISMELIIDRLSKQYKNKIAVDRISIKLEKGVYGLLGANGADLGTLQERKANQLQPLCVIR